MVDIALDAGRAPVDVKHMLASLCLTLPPSSSYHHRALKGLKAIAVPLGCFFTLVVH
jgi:hypothetical protein